MDWWIGIQNAIDYVEEHITEDINYEEIAKKASYSGFYFQRIFGAVCGMSLGEYIRNRRLTLAGNELNSSNVKVIEIALKYGYESPESFTRAFSKFHGITPSEAKKDGSKLKAFSRISVKITVSGGSLMHYKIVEKEAFEVIEKMEIHTTENGANLKSVPAFWGRANADGTSDKLLSLASDKTYLFGICYANKNENEKTFEYSIAAACDKDTPIPQGYRRNFIPARTWAVFACVGAMPNAIQDTWKKICTEFFPHSAYQPTRELDIEAYPDGDVSSTEYRCEIWLPVEKKNKT